MMKIHTTPADHHLSSALNRALMRFAARHPGVRLLYAGGRTPPPTDVSRKKHRVRPTPKGAKPREARARAAASPVYSNGAVITVLVRGNPKRPGAATHGLFALYRTGMTVAQYLAAGGRRRELNWDLRNGYVRVDEARH